MKDNAVAVIDAEGLLEWLKVQFRSAEDFCKKASDVKIREHWLGEMSALAAVKTHVRVKAYLVDKPADIEEE